MKKQRQAYSMTDSPNNTSKASPPTGGESEKHQGQSTESDCTQLRLIRPGISGKRTDR